MPKLKNKRKNNDLAAGDNKQREIRKEKETKIPKETAADNEPIIFAWETTDFIRKPLTEFYLTAAVFGLMAMIAWGIYSQSFVTAITSLATIIVIILVLNEEPQKIKVKISEKGIDLNEEHYNFRDFKSFKISYEDELPVLSFIQKKTLFLFRSLYIENESAEDLESFLEIFLEKKE